MGGVHNTWLLNKMSSSYRDKKGHPEDTPVRVNLIRINMSGTRESTYLHRNEEKD